VLGGFFEMSRRLFARKLQWFKLASPGVAVFAFLLSMIVTEVPDVLLQDEASASISSEYAFFFFRPDNPSNGKDGDKVVVWQEPAPASFPLGLRFCFASHHMRLSFLPFPVWPTLRCRLGDRPVVTITGLRPGHGENAHSPVPLQDGNARMVMQFHRVYGTFRNLPRDNDQLHLCLLVLPKKRQSRLADRSRRWWVQPHEVIGPNGTGLKLTYEDETSGTWYCDAFFGAPQSQGEPFEIMAIITARDLETGQVLRVDDVRGLPCVSDRVSVVRAY